METKADSFVKDIIAKSLERISSELKDKGINSNVKPSEKYAIILSFKIEDIPQYYSVSLEPNNDTFDVSSL